MADNTFQTFRRLAQGLTQAERVLLAKAALQECITQDPRKQLAWNRAMVAVDQAVHDAAK